MGNVLLEKIPSVNPSVDVDKVPLVAMNGVCAKNTGHQILREYRNTCNIYTLYTYIHKFVFLLMTR